jgi:hypothetical protein
MTAPWPLSSTSTQRLRDIPDLQADGSNSSAVIRAMREAVQIMRGHRGDPLDRAMTERRAIQLNLRSANGQALVGPGGTGGGGGVVIDPSPDLTPPPTPTGLVVTAGFTTLIIECAAQTYLMGRGHDRTVVYGAKWPLANPTAPTFAQAVKLYEFQGTVSAYSTDPETRWCIWIKWQSRDGVLSVSPAGGTNGAQASTAYDSAGLLEALAGQITGGQLANTFVISADAFAVTTPPSSVAAWTATAAIALNEVRGIAGSVSKLLVCKAPGTTGAVAPSIAGAIGSSVIDGSVTWQVASRVPFSVLTSPMTINGVPVPAGAYFDGAYMLNATINRAQIGLLAVDDARIANISVDKLTAGQLQVGAYAQSTGFVSGLGGTGWRLDGNGNLEASNVLLRGAIYATSGLVGGIAITSNSIQSDDFALGTAGFRLTPTSAQLPATTIIGKLVTNQIGDDAVTPQQISVAQLADISTQLGALDPFTASVTDGDLTVIDKDSGHQIYGSRTIVPAGGTPPYMYFSVVADTGWVFRSVGITSGQGTNTITISGSADGSTTSAVVGTFVIDINGRIAFVKFNVFGTHLPSPGGGFSDGE